MHQLRMSRHCPKQQLVRQLDLWQGPDDVCPFQVNQLSAGAQQVSGASTSQKVYKGVYGDWKLEQTDIDEVSSIIHEETAHEAAMAATCSYLHLQVRGYRAGLSVAAVGRLAALFCSWSRCCS